MADWKTSEEHEEIRELKKNNIAQQDSFNDTDKSLDQVPLSLDRSEPLVKRFTQQVRELVGNCKACTRSCGI